MSREKGPDEIFCRSCGEPIKRKAELCPECGVPNDRDDQRQTGRSTQQQRASTQGSDLPEQFERTVENAVQQFSSTSSEPHDPANHSTTVSSNWHYGVAVSVILWIAGFAIPSTAGPVAGFFFLTGWVLMPVSIYFDKQWLRATTQWNPPLQVWVLLAVVPLVNIVGGSVYLLRRRSVDRVSTPSANDGTGTAKYDDPALNELRERYSRGELTDEEFERKVEQVLGTEDEETAQMYIQSGNTDDSKNTRERT